MHRKNAEVKDSTLFEDRWVEYCREEKKSYLEFLFGYNRLMGKAGSLLRTILHPEQKVPDAL